MSAVLIGIPAAPGTRNASAARRVPATQSGKLRITRRGRLVLTTLAALPLIAGVAVFSLGAAGAAASSPGTQSSSVQFSYVTVDAGESLWQVAESIAPDADPRDVVAELMNLNQLPSATVVPGQRLAIPLQYAPSAGE